jgi:hypothetical protein
MAGSLAIISGLRPLRRLFFVLTSFHAELAGRPDKTNLQDGGAKCGHDKTTRKIQWVLFRNEEYHVRAAAAVAHTRP